MLQDHSDSCLIDIIPVDPRCYRDVGVECSRQPFRSLLRDTVLLVPHIRENRGCCTESVFIPQTRPRLGCCNGADMGSIPAPDSNEEIFADPLDKGLEIVSVSLYTKIKFQESVPFMQDYCITH